MKYTANFPPLVLPCSNTHLRDLIWYLFNRIHTKDVPTPSCPLHLLLSGNYGVLIRDWRSRVLRIVERSWLGTRWEGTHQVSIGYSQWTPLYYLYTSPTAEVTLFSIRHPLSTYEVDAKYTTVVIAQRCPSPPSALSCTNAPILHNFFQRRARYTQMWRPIFNTKQRYSTTRRWDYRMSIHPRSLQRTRGTTLLQFEYSFHSLHFLQPTTMTIIAV